MARAGVARAGASRFASSREEDGTVAEARDGGAGDGAGVGLPDDAGATLLDGVPAAAFFCGFTGLNFEVDLAGKSASEQAIYNTLRQTAWSRLTQARRHCSVLC